MNCSRFLGIRLLTLVALLLPVSSASAAPEILPGHGSKLGYNVPKFKHYNASTISLFYNLLGACSNWESVRNGSATSEAFLDRPFDKPPLSLVGQEARCWVGHDTRGLFNIEGHGIFILEWEGGGEGGGQSGAEVYLGYPAQVVNRSPRRVEYKTVSTSPIPIYVKGNTSGTNRITSVSLVGKGNEAVKNEFNPRALSGLQYASYLRFLDSTPNVATSSPGMPIPYRWSDISSGNQITVGRFEASSYKTQLDLAERLGSAAWLHVPYTADAEFFDSFAQYVQQQLSTRSTLRLFVEYSNETWNFDDVKSFLRDYALNNNLTNNRELASFVGYAEKTRQLLQALYLRIGQDLGTRVLLVTNHQNYGSNEHWRAVLEPLAPFASVIVPSTAPYFCNDSRDHATMERLTAGGIDAVLNFCASQIPDVTQRASNFRMLARQLGFQTQVAYEAGQHLVAPPTYDTLSTLASAVYAQASRHPMMGTITKVAHEEIINTGFSLITHYLSEDSGDSSLWGTWGAREAISRGPSDLASSTEVGLRSFSIETRPQPYRGVILDAVFPHIAYAGIRETIALRGRNFRSGVLSHVEIDGFRMAHHRINESLILVNLPNSLGEGRHLVQVVDSNGKGSLRLPILLESAPSNVTETLSLTAANYGVGQWDSIPADLRRINDRRIALSGEGIIPGTKIFINGEEVPVTLTKRISPYWIEFQLPAAAILANNGTVFRVSLDNGVRRTQELTIEIARNGALSAPSNLSHGGLSESLRQYAKRLNTPERGGNRSARKKGTKSQHQVIKPSPSR